MALPLRACNVTNALNEASQMSPRGAMRHERRRAARHGCRQPESRATYAAGSRAAGFAAKETLSTAADEVGSAPSGQAKRSFAQAEMSR